MMMLPMMPKNISLIKKGIKTTTLRQKMYPSGFYYLPDGTEIRLIHRGYGFCSDFDSYDSIFKSEGFSKDNLPRWQFVIDFLNDKEKLHFYEIKLRD